MFADVSVCVVPVCECGWRVANFISFNIALRIRKLFTSHKKHSDAFVLKICAAFFHVAQHNRRRLCTAIYFMRRGSFVHRAFAVPRYFVPPTRPTTYPPSKLSFSLPLAPHAYRISSTMPYAAHVLSKIIIG